MYIIHGAKTVEGAPSGYAESPPSPLFSLTSLPDMMPDPFPPTSDASLFLIVVFAYLALLLL